MAVAGVGGAPDRAVRSATLALLASRAEGASLCPSEVARAMAAGSRSADWRAEMPAVHAGIERMAADGLVRLTWKGVDRQAGEGPYRIHRGHQAG